MGLRKGCKPNNPDGRTPGTPNKISKSMRQLINDFLTDNWEQVQADFDSLEPEKRLTFYEKLLQYGIPRLASTTLTADGLTEGNTIILIDGTINT